MNKMANITVSILHNTQSCIQSPHFVEMTGHDHWRKIGCCLHYHSEFATCNNIQYGFTLLSLLQLGYDLVWQNRVTHVQHNNLLHFEGLTEVTLERSMGSCTSGIISIVTYSFLRNIANDLCQEHIRDFLKGDSNNRKIFLKGFQ